MKRTIGLETSLKRRRDSIIAAPRMRKTSQHGLGTCFRLPQDVAFLSELRAAAGGPQGSVREGLNSQGWKIGCHRIVHADMSCHLRPESQQLMWVHL